MRKTHAENPFRGQKACNPPVNLALKRPSQAGLSLEPTAGQRLTDIKVGDRRLRLHLSLSVQPQGIGGVLHPPSSVVISRHLVNW